MSLGGVVGSASVLVVPQTTSFEAQVKQKVEGALRGVQTQVPIGADTRQADTAVGGLVSRTNATRSTHRVDADTRVAEQKLSSFRSFAAGTLASLTPLGGGAFLGASRGLDETADKSTKAAAGLLAVGLAGRHAINSASSLEEQQNKVNVVFEDSADVVTNFGERAAESAGLSERASASAAGSFGTLFRGAQLSTTAAADMSLAMVTLASDLASFNDISPEIALEKLRSGLVGEIEPLRVLGVNFDQAEVKAKGLAMGLGQATGELSKGEEIQARYALILEKTTRQQGDFTRTSASLANQKRVLAGNVENLSAALGEGLLPAATQVVGVFNSGLWVLDSFGVGMKPLVEIGLLALGASVGVKILSAATLGQGAAAATTATANTGLAASEVAVGTAAAGAAPGVGLLTGAMRAFIPVAALFAAKAAAGWSADKLGLHGQVGDWFEAGIDQIADLEERIPVVGDLLAGLDRKALGAGHNLVDDEELEGGIQLLGAFTGEVVQFDDTVAHTAGSVEDFSEDLGLWRDQVLAAGGSAENLDESATKLRDHFNELGGSVGVSGAALLNWANGDAKAAEAQAKAVAAGMESARSAFLGDFSLTETFSGANLARDAEQGEQATERLAASRSQLAEANERYAEAQINAAERVAEAEQRYSDAQISAAERVLDAEQNLADARTNLADLRESQAWDAREEQEAYAAKVEDVNARILDAEANLASQRVSLAEQVADAQRRLEEGRESGARRIQDAEERLSDLLERQRGGTNPAMQAEISRQQELRRARAAVEDARREAAENEKRDIAAVEKARRAETLGILEAEEQVTEARQEQLGLGREAERLVRSQLERQREMERAVREVGEAEKAVNDARAEGARQIADAEKAVGEARRDGAREIGRAAAAVSDAQGQMREAQAETNAEIRLTSRLLDGTNAGIDALAFAWGKIGGFVDPLVDTRVALRRLLHEAGDLSPVQKKIVNFYQDSLVAGQVFSDNIRTAIQQGYDPQLIANLLTQGPKEAGPLLQEMVNDHTGRLREFVNAGEAALRDQSGMMVETARLTHIAINATNDQVAADLRIAHGIMQAQSAEGGRLTVQALADKLGVGREVIARTVTEYGITIGDGLNVILGAIGAPILDVVHGLASRIFAGGGTLGRLPQESGFHAPGTIVQYAEPETGGEYHAFIPRANDHRRRGAVDVLGTAAEDLGYTLVPKEEFAVGGKTAGLNADFLRRLERWSETIPGGFLNITSGLRTYEEQAELYRRYRAGTGNLAAPPGRSRHETGMAADHSPASWPLAATATPFGIAHPVAGEPWHAEPSGGVVPGAAGSRTPIPHVELPPVPDWSVNHGWGFGQGAENAWQVTRDRAQAWINAKEAEMAADAAAANAGGAGPAHVGGDIDAWINEAIRITGAPQSWFPGLKARAMQESGGRNIPQQITDINSQRGDPAFGPMQVIRCVPLDTEILTRRGWVAHDEVRVGDETPGFNPETQATEWTPVVEVFHYDEAEVWRIGNGSWHARITPNHRWWSELFADLTERGKVCPECGSSWPTERGMETHYGRKHRKRLPQTRKVIGRFATPATFTDTDRLRVAAPAVTDGDIPLTDDEVRIVAWAVGDGHVRGTPESSQFGVCIYQAKPRMVLKLRELLRHVPHSEYVRQRPGNRRPEHCFYLRASYARDLFKRSGLFDLGHEGFVLNLRPSQRGAYLDAMIDAEGNRVKGAKPGWAEFVRIAQNDGAVQDAIVLAAYLHGYRPSRRSVKRAKREWQPSGIVGLCLPHVWPAMFNEPEVLERQPVWCVRTGLGTWTMKQDGQVMLTGNSTFERHKEPGYDDWHNPVHNIAAAVNYIESRYGDPYHLPRGGYAMGGILRSFAGGGIVPGDTGAPSLAIVHGGEEIRDPTVTRNVSAPTTISLTLNVPVTVGAGVNGRTVAQEVEAVLLRSNVLERAASKIEGAMVRRRRATQGAT